MFALLVVLSIAFPAASADAAGRALVTGTVAGTAPFKVGGPCSFVHQRYVARVTSARGANATLNVDMCVFASSNGFAGVGTFALTTPSGAATGSADGQIIPNGTTAQLAFNLHVIATASGVVAHPGELLHLVGTWHSNLVDGGPITGTIVDHG